MPGSHKFCKTPSHTSSICHLWNSLFALCWISSIVIIPLKLKEYFPENIFHGKIFQICLLIFSLNPPCCIQSTNYVYIRAIIGNLIFSREAAGKHFRKLGEILISCWSYIRIRVDQHHTNIMSFFLSLCCTGPIIQIMFIVIPDIFIVTNILTAVHCYFRVSSSPLDWVTTAFMWLLELDFKQDLTRAEKEGEFYFL